MKKTLSLLLPLMLSNAAFADHQGSIYARLNVSAQSSDDGEGSFSEIKSNNSWYGIAGSYQLNDQLEAFYKLEFNVDITSEKEQGDNIKERPQFIGIRGNFGQVAIGRDFSSLWRAQGKIDLFNHYEGDMKLHGKFKGENRLSDVLVYTSPSFYQTKLSVTYQAEKEVGADAGVSIALLHGDKYLNKTNLFLALAQDFEVNGYDVTRASGQYKFGQHKVGAIWQQQQKVGSDEDQSGWLLSYQYRFTDIALKTQYQELEQNDQASIGIDYHLGSDTIVYAWASNASLIQTLDGEINDQDRRYFAIGIEQKLSYSF